MPIGLNAPRNTPVAFRMHRSEGTSPADIVRAETQVVTVDRGHYTVLEGNGSATGQAVDPFTNDLTGVLLAPECGSRLRLYF